MTTLRQIQYAFAHDPIRLGDRSPHGAVPAGTKVKLILRAEESVRDRVYGVWLEVFDPERTVAAASESGSDEVSANAGDEFGIDEEPGWVSIAMERCRQGYYVNLDTAGEPRVLFYRFRVRTDEGDVLCARRIDDIATAGSAFVPNIDVPEQHMPGGFQLTVYDPAFEAPSWFTGSIMYQIFPDRFARGSEGVRWSGVESHCSRGWPVYVHENWNEPPTWGDQYDPVDFFGGNFAGIEEKLDYLVSLGIDVIYLNPVCEARSNHRYNTGDYDAIDPILGDWSSFEALKAAATERGIRIVLDTVLSHTGSASLYFNADRSYDSFGAAQGDGSPYRSWYDFYYSDGAERYRCWWGDATLPEVEEHNGGWQRYVLGEGFGDADAATGDAGGADIFGSPAGVLGRWLSHGVDGLRLDVADEIPDDVLELIRDSAKGASADTVIIGEVWEDPTTKESYGEKRTYALGRALDSVMNYPLRSALIQFAVGGADAHQLTTFLKLQRSNYPRPLYDSLMNLLSSHDVERIRSVLSLGCEFRELDRNDQARIVGDIGGDAEWRGARLQRILATLIYALPGVPCLYYGDERGMQGGRDPFDRGTFPWDGPREDCGHDLTEFYQRLGKLRHSYKVLSEGDAAFYAFGSDVACILRTPHEGDDEEDVFLCVANRSDHYVRFVVDLVDASAGLSEDAAMHVRFADSNPRCVFATDGDKVSIGVDAACEYGIFSGGIDGMQARVYQLTHGLEKPLDAGVGVICHVTSVPNAGPDGENVGHGTLGEPAKRFVDRLSECGVKYWQILPLNPTDEFGSPYAGLSAFAGNTRLLDAEALSNVDPDALAGDENYLDFVERNKDWLIPYATFVAVKETLGEVTWPDWPEEYRTWHPGIEDDPALAAHVKAECARQYEFDRQWGELHAYANSRGVKIIGDMPIYVSADSADVWSHREYFALDDDGRVSLQGGVPPDAFAAQGQLWGNPVYRWDVLRDHGYDWWLRRFERMFEWYDYVRIDHFLGFSSYYEIPAGKTAAEGSWIPGPGFGFFKRAYEKFGPLPVVAEDLGIITPDVRQLLAQTGFQGMDVLQFADGDPRYDWRHHKGKIAFTSTHDTPTLVGWALDRYCGGNPEDERALNWAIDIAHGMEDAALTSDAAVIIMSLQDVLELDNFARMNVPGTAGGNWEWQAKQSELDAKKERLSNIAGSR